ncbi:MAG: GGDEF domain-containing protein [Treponema sp.]|nr:GGDEF domain-containing protein [Treponema sp.]
MSGNLFYPLFSTGLILVAVFINYLGRTGTDLLQRRIYFSALVFIFASITAHFAGTMLEGRAGSTVHILLLIIFNIFILFQLCSWYLTVVFLDYLVNRSAARTRKFIYIVIGLMAVNIIVLAVNYSRGFYFTISQDNYFENGTQFLVRFYMSYSAVLMAIIDIIISKKKLHSVQIRLIVFFALLCGAGAIADLLLPGGNFIWAFLTTAMLISYFFIIHGDSVLDTLTGLGNRSGLMEFINQISRSYSRQSYTMVLFDIDDLARINNKFGAAAGNKALTEMAELLKNTTRQYDFIARSDSDEFFIAIKSDHDTDKMIGRILNSLDALNRKEDRQFSLSVSYGYRTWVPKEEPSIDEFLQHLKEQVYRYKNEQRSESGNIRRSAGA